MKLKEIKSGKEVVGYYFWCPGCQNIHIFYTNLRDRGKCWKFNGDLEKPTFSPSLLNFRSPTFPRCHLVIEQGWICYCEDSEHRLAGLNIQLPELPENWR